MVTYHCHQGTKTLVSLWFYDYYHAASNAKPVLWFKTYVILRKQRKMSIFNLSLTEVFSEVTQ